MVAEDQGRVDGIAGRDRLKYPVAGFAHDERHSHAFHQAGNVLVSDGQLARAGIDGDYATFQFVALSSGSIGAGCKGN